jgi:gamma-glutamyltranspeptidase
MIDLDRASAVFNRLNKNQVALSSAIEELSIWVEQGGAVETALAVRLHLTVVKKNSKSITGDIVKLMRDSD